MSKKDRIIVKVDEDKIKRMIAGDEPYLQETPTLKHSAQENGEEVFGGDTSENNNRNDKIQADTPRKRKSKIDYAGIFLNKSRDSSKKQTTILLPESIFGKMEMLLGATKGLSMAMFISNVLLHHFEEYEDDINVIKEKYIEKLSKNM